ncbi:hypothetical protein CYMTET_48650 [Cymbomonas tetramitiformis]|uniref:Uncharacterized protein n=1 Tax=Cymbomonas tetramitiformis TaxID=36881 RepID=A0AAE0BT38_9CHLO|nr:hypothetical protein CYMTET_48650 [Cymbomonas tetramitiformis]
MDFSPPAPPPSSLLIAVQHSSPGHQQSVGVQLDPGRTPPDPWSVPPALNRQSSPPLEVVPALPGELDLCLPAALARQHEMQLAELRICGLAQTIAGGELAYRQPASLLGSIVDQLPRLPVNFLQPLRSHPELALFQVHLQAKVLD